MTEKTPASGYELHVKGTGNYDWAAAAAEMKSLNGPCPRDTVIVANCSAVKRMVIDYGDLRQRIRAAREKD